jgi:hypothetical protein
MPQDSNNQNYYSSFSERIVASCIGGFVGTPIQPYQMDEDELREINDR